MRNISCCLCAVLLCSGTLWAQQKVAETAPEPTGQSLMAVVGDQTLEFFDLGETGEPRDGDSRSSCSGVIQLGSGTSTTGNYPLSAITNPCYARSMSLIRRSEMSCIPYQITQIAVYVSTARTYNFTNVEIRMLNTTTTAYPSGTVPWDGSGTLVYGPATVQMNPTGWKTFVLATPFIWDADYNLQITWQGQSTGGGTTNNVGYYQTADLGYRCEAMSNSSTAYNNNMTPFQMRPQYQLTFVPTLTGACCTGMDCTFTDTEADCITMGGNFMGTGTDCTPNPCIGACCYDYPNVQCTNAPDAATCTATYNGIWHQYMDCATYYCPPWNDDCAAVPSPTLVPGEPITITGDTRGATADCSYFSGNNAWVNFTLSADYGFPYWEVTLDYCGTSPAFTTAWLNRAVGCPCSNFTAAGAYDSTTCGDGNRTIWWGGLSNGAQYYPVRSVDPGAFGPYTIHVVARQGYCASYASNTADSLIKEVHLNTIDNDSGLTCIGRSNFTMVSTDLERGATYPVSVVASTCGTCSAKWTKIFIDWNQDYDLTDGGEQVFSSTVPATCPITVSGNITVPVTATLGPTRMRVVLVQGGSEASVVACGTFTYGETEDYTVNVIDPVRACCSPDGSCAVTTEAECAGVWHPEWADCSVAQCPQLTAACCAPDGSCTVTAQADCMGVWHPEWADCDAAQCPQPTAACCYPDGSCAVTTQADCAGVWHPEWPDCDAAQCPQPTAACCYPDGSCAVTPQADCAGVWHPEWADCGVAQCPAPSGSCCYPDGSCAETLQADCTGVWTMFGTCTPNICEQPDVACCFGDGSCQMLTDEFCAQAGGTPGAYGSTCTPNDCPQPSAACCYENGTCAVTVQADCTGTWHPEWPDCTGVHCVICLGDLNCDGVVNFGDINPFVLYLSDFALWQQYYAGCPWQNGDINGDGTYGQGSFGDINPFVALMVQSPFQCN